MFDWRIRGRGLTQHRQQALRETWSWKSGFGLNLLGKRCWRYSSDNGSNTERHALAYYARIRVRQARLKRKVVAAVAIVAVLFAGL